MKENTQRQVVPADRLDVRELLMKVIPKWPLLLAGALLGLAVAWLVNRYQKNVYRVKAVVNVEQAENPLAQSGISLVVNTFGENQLEVKQLVLESLELHKKAARNLGWEVNYFLEGSLSRTELYRKVPVTVHFDRAHVQPVGIPFYINPEGDSFILSWGEVEGNAVAYHYETEQTVNMGPLDLPTGKFEFGQWIEGSSYKFKIEKNFEWAPDLNIKLGANFRTILSLARANKGALIVEPSKESTSSTMTLSAEGYDPFKLTDLVNGTIEALRAHELERKNERAKNTLEFIDNQLKGILNELRSSELMLEEFRATNLIIDLSAESEALLGQFSTIDNSLTENIFLQHYYEYVIDFLSNNSQLKGLSLPPLSGLEDPVVAALTQRLVELNSKLETAKYTLNANNPEYKRIVTELTYTKESLKQAASNALEHTRNIEKDLQKRFEELQKGVTALPSKEQQLINIQRRYETYGRQYELLLEKRAEAGILQASNLPDTQIIDPATHEGLRPISPDRLKNLLLGFGGGLAIPILLIIVFDTLNDKIRVRRDIELMTAIPILGGIGHHKSMDNLVVINKPKSTVTESFRALRANLKFIIPDLKVHDEKEGKVIMITSSIGGEGKSFISSNLSLTLSTGGFKTCLVGADLRKPKILQDFNVNNEIGLSNYLTDDELELKDLVRQTEYQGLDVIGSGDIPPNPAEILGRSRFDDLLNDLKAQYDVIILDTPPIGLVADALQLSPKVDGTIYVTRFNYTPKGLLGFINDQYENESISNIGIVLNDQSTKGAYGYGYGYGFGYGYGYGRGYGYGGYGGYGAYGSYGSYGGYGAAGYGNYGYNEE